MEKGPPAGPAADPEQAQVLPAVDAPGQLPNNVEEGWVFIEQEEERQPEAWATGADEQGASSSSSSSPSPTVPLASSTSASYEQFYPHHLQISTRWVGGVGGGCSRWVRSQWQECERYARHIARFFPGEEVVERRRAVAEEERQRAMMEAHHYQEAELTRQRTLEARRRRESESMYTWLEAILQRWAAVDAQKRREQEAGEEEEEARNAAASAGSGMLDHQKKGVEMPTQVHSKHEQSASPDACEAKKPAAEDREMEEEKRAAATGSSPGQIEQAAREEEEERRRLKEEGRRRFKEWKQKEQADGTDAASNKSVPPVPAATTSASPLAEDGTKSELEEWELISAAKDSPNKTTEGTCTSGPADKLSQSPFEQISAQEPTHEPVDNDGGVDGFNEQSLVYLRQRILETMGDRSDIRFIPFHHTRDKVLASFEHWRRSLWFAPAGFSHMIDGQRLEAVWMPYYSMRLTVISSFKSKLVLALQTSPSDSQGVDPQQKAKKLESKEISVSKESSYESLLVCASVEEPDQVLMKSIEDWNIEPAMALWGASVPSAAVTAANAGYAQGELTPITVRAMIGANDAWKKAEKEIITREKEACRQLIQNEHNPHKIQQLILTKLTFKGRPSFSVIYVPVYVITYLHKEKQYAYVVNGQTGKASGERPYGMGNVLGGGIGLLENIFGINEQETAGILSGQALKKLDNSPYYHEAGWYLVFPPSHSYLITSATGYITLRNAGTRDILLASQPRGGEKVIATYVLKGGEVESFDYKGNWCIELKHTEGDRGQPDIELVEFHTSGGGNFGNKLGMSYWLL